MQYSKILIFILAVMTFNAVLAKDSNAELYACIEEEAIAMDKSENWGMFRVRLDRFTIEMDFDAPSVKSEKLGLIPFNTVCTKSLAGGEFSCITGWGKSFTYNTVNSRFLWAYNATDGDDPAIAVGTCELF